MASYYTIIDVPAKKEEIPLKFDSLDDIGETISLEERPWACTYSHRNAVSNVLTRMVSAYELKGLFYLSQGAVVLDHVSILSAIEGIENLFKHARLNIRDFVLRTEMAVYTNDSPYVQELSAQILSTINGPEQTPIPDELRDDEGEGLIYALAYLKAHLVVLRFSLHNCYFVLHASDYTDPPN